MQIIISQNLSKYNNLIQGLAIGDFKRLRFGEDKSENHIKQIVKNRKNYFKNFGIDLKNVVMQNQIHQTKITLVTEKDCGKGVFNPNTYIKDNDGLITKDKNIFLVCFTADCLPISFYDPKLKICGIAHSGWKGTLGNIALKMINEFKKLGSGVKDIVVYVGPAIGKCCYEISKAKDDRVVKFEKFLLGLKPACSVGRAKPQEELIIKKRKKIYLDLKKIVRAELLNTGVQNENIEISEICTSCDERFPSYYRDKGFKSDLLSIIGMK
ncbi:MAG: peptidoglycan editing factor PgeF [Patescibacteria group bacterium]|nr:peptidoglycan editing factor PgeF [Patescibacteria group bacterium]